MWWMSLEVLDGAFSAARWQDAHAAFLVEAALAHGARDWHWQRHAWGVIFEVAFPDEDSWDRYRALPAVTAALDAVPDPVAGLLIYRGRGGSSGRTAPRWPRPRRGGGAAALPLPADDRPPPSPADPRHTEHDLEPAGRHGPARRAADVPA
jgi:hypothetical protein